MPNRRTIGWIAALMASAALVGGAPTRAVAQAAPPAQAKIDTAKKKSAPDTAAKRIKIKKDVEVKEAGGEVCLPPSCTEDRGATRLDISIEREQWIRDAQRHLDSIEAETRLQREITRMRIEAAALKERAWRDSIARAEETERVAQLAMKRHLARGWYFGIAGGASMPQRDIRDGYTGGWATMVPIGWDASDSRFGFRGDLSVDHLNGTRVHSANNTTTAASGDLTVWSLTTDLKVRAHAPGTPTRTHIYALGGIGAHRVVNGVYGVAGPDAGKNLSFENAKTSFGWNVGAGMSTAWGPTELFIESRFFQIKTDLNYHMNGGVGTYTSFTPIVIGLQWF